MRQTIAFIHEKKGEFLNIEEIFLTKNILESLEGVEVGVVIFALVSSITIGSYFKSGFYFYIYDNRKMLKERPINILLLFQFVIEHLICLTTTLFLIFGIPFGPHVDFGMGKEANCLTIFNIGGFAILYRNFGGLGIACIRLMFLFHSHWIKECFGKLKMMMLVLLCSIGVSVWMIVKFGNGNGPAPRKQELMHFCMQTSEMAREIEHQYDLIRGLVAVEEEDATTALLLSLGCVVAELCCYVTIFLHLYTHDNGLAKRKILPANEINRRHQKNAITLLGQFYGFGFEIIFYVGLLISVKSKDSFGNWNKLFKVVMVTGFWIEFGLLSIVEVMTSKCLKENLPHNRFFR